MKLDQVAKYLKNQADRYPRVPKAPVPLRHWARLKRGLVLRLTREDLGGGRGECYNLMLHRDHARPSDTEIQVCIAAFFPGAAVEVIKKESRFRVHVLCPVNKKGECEDVGN